jgi:hypothetical protein
MAFYLVARRSALEHFNTDRAGGGRGHSKIETSFLRI